MRILLFFCFVGLISCSSLSAGTVPAPLVLEESPAARQIVSLLAYVEKDYGGAVQNGEVKSLGEYEEQKVFVRDMLSIANDLPSGVKLSAGGTVQEKLIGLLALIEKKARAEDVATTCKSLKEEMIRSYALVLGPSKPLVAGRGATLYATMCAECHGKDGRAETQRSKELDPAPASFHDPEVMGPLSPYRAYNILSFGVGMMPSYELVSEEDRWALAFYVFEFRHTGNTVDPTLLSKLPPSVPRSAGLLARYNDNELLALLRSANVAEPKRMETLAALRIAAPYQHDNALEALAQTRRQIRNAEEAYATGDNKAAYDAALQAYLGSFESVESSLRTKDSALLAEAESSFLELRAVVRDPSNPKKVQLVTKKLREQLDRAESILTSSTSSAAFTAFASAILIVREGIEAALVITAILALLARMERKDAKKYVHAGWVSALICGSLSFLAVQQIISMGTASRDFLEGVFTLLASVVLFFTSYWLISKTEAQRWVTFLQRNVKERVSNGNLIALTGLAFLAVFREAFETVLFYQAMILDPSASTFAIVSGAVLGFVLLGFAIWGLQRLGKKMPIQKFFGYSGAMLYTLSIIFVGGGLHELQEAGYLNPWPVSFVRIDLLGIYPDLLTLSAQLVLVAAAIFAFVLPILKRSNTAPQPQA